MSGEAQGSPQPMFPRWVLTAGFCTGLVLAFVALLACLAFLGIFLVHATSNMMGEPKNADHAAAMTRLGLQGCGVLAGVAFGFLGFSLFLLGVRGESDVAMEYQNWKLTLSRMSPGVLVVLCSCVLVYLSLSYAIPSHLAPRFAPNTGTAAGEKKE